MKKSAVLLLTLGMIFSLSGKVKAEGTVAAEFLKFGVGARYLGMGSAATAVADDANALYWNPANLGGMESGHATMMQADTLDQGRYSYAAIGLPLQRWGAVAAGFQYASVGTLAATDAGGNPLGDFRPRDSSLSLGWGRRWGDHWAIGAGGQWVHSRILHTADAFALDAGGAYRWRFLSAGVSFRQAVSTPLKYEREKEHLPRAAQAGVAARWGQRWLTAADVNFTRGSDPMFAVGGEYGHPLSVRQQLFLRAGYQTRPGDLPGSQGASFGLGWRWDRLDVDYAFLPMGQVDGMQTHRISVGLRFGGVIEPTGTVPPPSAGGEASGAKDEDGDGVPDSVDRCPGTPPATRVDALGCSAAPLESPLPAPVKKTHTNVTCPAKSFGVAVHNIEGCRVDVKPDIRFVTDSAKVEPVVVAGMATLAEFLVQFPNYSVEIQGHADTRGDGNYNQDLSERRAAFIRQALIEKYGIQESRLSTVGFGESRPDGDNQTPEGRAQNRRVVIILKEPYHKHSPKK